MNNEEGRIVKSLSFNVYRFIITFMVDIDIMEQRLSPIDAAYAVSDKAVDSRISRGNSAAGAEHVFNMALRESLRPVDVRRFLRNDIKGLKTDRKVVDKNLILEVLSSKNTIEQKFFRSADLFHAEYEVLE